MLGTSHKTLSLNDGDILTMGGKMQERYQHSVSKCFSSSSTTQGPSERFNLTWRTIVRHVKDCPCESGVPPTLISSGSEELWQTQESQGEAKHVLQSPPPSVPSIYGGFLVEEQTIEPSFPAVKREKKKRVSIFSIPSVYPIESISTDVTADGNRNIGI